MVEPTVAQGDDLAAAVVAATIAQRKQVAVARGDETGRGEPGDGTGCTWSAPAALPIG